jgi:hypothetical protein
MLKTLTLVLAGLAAGFTVALWLQPDPPDVEAAVPSALPAATKPSAGGAAPSVERLAALESALAVEAEQRAALETRIDQLAAELDVLREARPAENQARNRPPGFDPAEARQRFDPVARVEEAQRRNVEQLVAGGFSPQRAEWIMRRTQELRMESLQAQYDATRDGRPTPGPVDAASDRTLRSELGDAEYEQYLRALDRPTSVSVLEVLASSPAERAGLKPGDEVISYGGERVFEMRDLNALTLQGTEGQSVAVEVQRDGQRVQLVLPRGPIGISGGFRGPRGPQGAPAVIINPPR